MRPKDPDHDVDPQLVAAMDQVAARFTRRRAIHDLGDTLVEIVAGAVAVVAGVCDAGLTVLEPDGWLTSSAPASEIVTRLDQAQTLLRHGPCVILVLQGRSQGPKRRSS